MAEEFEQDNGEKTEEPTQHRIDEFRKRGEVASSKELASILILSASILTLSLSMVFVYETTSEFLRWLYGLDIASAFSQDKFKTIISKTVLTGLKCVAPMFLVTICVGVIAQVAQIGFLFSPEVLEWKPERINPINGFKKLFSTQSLMEALKGILKFSFILAIVYFFIKEDLNSYRGFYQVSFLQAFLLGKSIIVKLMYTVIGGLFIVALADFAYQKIRYRNKLRMTKEQVKKEQKEREGNPEIKQRIRAIQKEMSRRRMMDEVKKADVVITNPTHISVALKYDSETMISPQVVAKGTEHLALGIRRIAKEHDVPMVENVPLARALYNTVQLNTQVPRTLYTAVANVMTFVYNLKRKKKALG